VRNNNDIIKNWVIYKITSPNGSIYIGKSSLFKGRINAYKCNKGLGQPKLNHSILKYGFDNHIIDIVDKFESNCSYAAGKEMFWIRSYMSNYGKFPSQNGMNLTDGGDGTLGYKKSEEEKKKMRERNLGKKHSQEWKDKMSLLMKGRKLGKHKTRPSKESVEKRAAQLRGRKYTEEQKAVYANAVKKRSRAISQYGLDGSHIKTFNSISEATRQLKINNIFYQIVGIVKSKHFLFKYA